MSQAQMVKTFGTVKAMGKINSGKLLSRADQDSGLDDEENKEYKVYFDEGNEIERDVHGRTMKVDDENLSAEEAK